MVKPWSDEYSRYGIIYCIYQNLQCEDCQNLDYKVGDALSHSLELDRIFIAMLNILQTNNLLNVNNFVLTAASLVPQCTCLHGDLITICGIHSDTSAGM